MADRRPLVVDVVDDDEAVRDSTQAVLESYEFVVRAHCSADAFLNAATERRGDCLLVDQHMPGMAGVELVERLRAEGDATPVIMLTAKDDPAFRARAARAGIVKVLAKPTPIEEILLWLRQACGQSDSRA